MMLNTKDTIKKVVRRVNDYLAEDDKQRLVYKFGAPVAFNPHKPYKDTNHVILVEKSIKFDNRAEFNKYKKKLMEQMAFLDEHPAVRTGPLIKNGKWKQGDRVLFLKMIHDTGWRAETLFTIYFRSNRADLDLASKKVNPRNMFDFKKPIQVGIVIINAVHMLFGHVNEPQLFEHLLRFGYDLDCEKAYIMSKYLDWITAEKLGTIEWGTIGGMAAAKNMMEKLTIKMDENDIFDNEERDHILLVGPPGVGKTLLIRGMLSRLYGKANILPYNLVADLLNAMAEDGPTDHTTYILNFLNQLHEYTGRWTYLFIDEIDSIAQTNTNAKALLREMDNVGKRKFSIIGTTNRPDIMDFALFRPGRFYPIIHVDLPDEKDRKEIWDIANNKFELNLTNNNISRITDDSKLFSGADIIHIGRMASREKRFAAIDNIPEFDTQKYILAYISKHKTEISSKNKAWRDRVKSFLNQSEATVMYV